MKGNTTVYLWGKMFARRIQRIPRYWLEIHYFDNNRVPVGQFHPTEDRHARSEIFDSATNSHICSELARRHFCSVYMIYITHSHSKHPNVERKLAKEYLHFYRTGT